MYGRKKRKNYPAGSEFLVRILLILYPHLIHSMLFLSELVPLERLELSHPASEAGTRSTELQGPITYNNIIAENKYSHNSIVLI